MSEAIIKAINRLHDEGPDPFEAATFEASLALIRTAVDRLAWGTMTYRCQACGFEWRIWLSLGVEGPPQFRASGLYLAAPFMVRCPAWPGMKGCDGQMQHVRWIEDETFREPVLIPDAVARFVLPYSADRGDTGARLEIPGPALIRARQAMNEDPDA